MCKRFQLCACAGGCPLKNVGKGTCKNHGFQTKFDLGGDI